MTITKTLLLAGFTVASLAGSAMAQSGPDHGQEYSAEQAAKTARAPASGQVTGQIHSFFYHTDKLNQGTHDFPAIDRGEG